MLVIHSLLILSSVLCSAYSLYASDPQCIKPYGYAATFVNSCDFPLKITQVDNNDQGQYSLELLINSGLGESFALDFICGSGVQLQLSNTNFPEQYTNIDYFVDKENSVIMVTISNRDCHFNGPCPFTAFGMRLMGTPLNQVANFIECTRNNETCGNVWHTDQSLVKTINIPFTTNDTRIPNSIGLWKGFQFIACSDQDYNHLQNTTSVS